MEYIFNGEKLNSKKLISLSMVRWNGVTDGRLAKNLRTHWNISMDVNYAKSVRDSINYTETFFDVGHKTSIPTYPRPLGLVRKFFIKILFLTLKSSPWSAKSDLSSTMIFNGCLPNDITYHRDVLALSIVSLLKR